MNFSHSLSLPAALFCLATTVARAEPVNVIFDTDIGPDCDDVGAVAVLHSLADRGETRLLAMMVCTSPQWGAPCLDALNTYFGRPDIPIGTLKDAGFLDKSGYPEAIARRYPHDLASGVDAPDATVLYRQVLAAQPDGSVVVAAVGPLRNLRKLLDSGADAFSPLNGRDLVAKKVARLVCMGGKYPKGSEWNFEQDGEAARVVAGRWPTPILFSGGELGSGIMAGRALALHAPEHDPVTMAYGLYVGYGRDRETWDLTGALAAVRGTMPSLKTSEPGTNGVDEKGHNIFKPDPAGLHRYLILDGPKQPLEDLLEELMLTAKAAPIAFDHELTLFVKDGFGTASAHGSEHGDNTARLAFDRSPNAWHGKTGGSWLQFSLPDGRARAASSYVIARKDGRDSWKLSGSKDGGESWTVLDAQTGAEFAEQGQPRRFRFQNTTPYTHYRLEFSTDSKPSVPDFSLFERIERTAGVAVQSVALDRPALRLTADTSATLNAAIAPRNALAQELTWTSSAPEIASVRPLGSSAAAVHGLAPGTATITATSVDGKKSAACEITVAPGSLPAPWKYAEVNTPDVSGGASFADGVFTLTGGGETLMQWWKRKLDQFALLSQPLAGDGSISARLVAQTSIAAEAQSGVTLRQSTEKNSLHACLVVRADGEARLIWRDKKSGDDPGEMKLGKRPLPVFLKLERRGEDVLAFTSTDGTAWGDPVGRCPVAFSPGPVLAGAVSTASSRPITNTATLEHLTVTP